MVKRLWFAGILLLFIQFPLNAQMDELRLGLTLQPFPLIEYYQGGNLRVGVQTRVAPRIFLHGEFGKYLSFLSYNTQELKGYNWRAAIQYNYSAYFYIGVDYFYKDHSFDLTDEIDLSGNVYEKSYRLQKYANSITFKWGRLSWTRKKRGYTDWYGGLGLRVRNVSLTGLSEEELSNITSSSFIYNAARKQGTIISPELAFGFRMGLTLLRKK